MKPRASLSLALLAAALLGAAAPAGALQLPLKLNYQGRLIDPSTKAPRNGTYTLLFRVVNAASGGTVLWGPETHELVLSNGAFTAVLGQSLALSPELFSHASAYLSVLVSPGSYPADEILPRQQLLAAPYAFTAAQLAIDGELRLNARVAYSTFTAGGDLQLAHGVSAATGSFTATGNAQFSLTSSSGISVSAGTLKLASSSGGLFAEGASITGEHMILNDLMRAQQLFGIGASTSAVKTADESALSDVLQDDDQLALPIGAGQVWVYEGMLNAINASATPDLKIAFTVPTGATMRIAYQCMYGNLASGVANTLTVSGTASSLIFVGAGVDTECQLRGVVDNPTNAGIVRLQWAQNTADASNATTIKANSFLEGMRIR